MTAAGAAPAGYPKHLHLRRPAEFRRVFKGLSQRSSDRLMTVLALDNGLDHPRLGLAISRKVSARAVDRNRLKRLVRESFRRHQHRLGGRDIVVVGRPAMARAEPAEVRRRLEQHWQRITGP